MVSISTIKRQKSFYIEEKRSETRAFYSQDILSPLINGKKPNIKNLTLKVDNISLNGVGIVSNMPILKDTFLDIMITIEGYPSFNILTIVRWNAFDDNNCIIGCEFIDIKPHQAKIIKNYIDKCEDKCICNQE